MRRVNWPPTKAWTSASKREGYRHFEVKQFGGKGTERWVELFPINKKEQRLKVSWEELKDQTKWASGWVQIPKDND